MTQRGRRPRRPAGESISVLVPAFRRPADLSRCLDAIEAQRRPPQEVVVARRSDDGLVAGVLAGRPGVVEVVVAGPGMLRALGAAARRSSGDLLAITDDDAAPHPDWLALAARALADPAVGVVGGRDVIIDHPMGDDPPAPVVGALTRWGRLIGRAHAGSGRARATDVVKAVNMVARREALALPLGLRGAGAEAHFEVACCLWAAARGWRVVYDPAILVDHHLGARLAGGDRERRTPAAQRDSAFNLVTSIHVPRRRVHWRRAAFGTLVGDRDVPGLLRAAVALAEGDGRLASLLPASLAGQAEALVRAAAGWRAPMVPVGR